MSARDLQLTPDAIRALVHPGLGDVARCELEGADAVGTDDYPLLRDAWPKLVDALRSSDAALRMAAAHALALLIEPFVETTQPALDAAALAATTPAERAAMILAAGRLRATIAQWRKTQPEVPYGGLPLSDAASRESEPIVRGALVMVEIWELPDWDRAVRPEVASALDALDGLVAGPWGGGDLGALARRVRSTVNVETRSTDWQERAASYNRGDGDPAVTDEADAPFGEDEVDDPYTQERPVRAPPRVALPGLGDVAWGELEHAYGSAEGVPGMIDALSSPLAADRAWGFDALDASIHHQGSVYSASAPAVPFLAALLDHPEIEGRDRILLLLAGLAVHAPRWHLFSDLAVAASPAFSAVSACASAFVPLLADGDGAVRSAAAHALSFVTPPRGAADAVRSALAVERDRYVRSSLLLALGYLGRRTKQEDDRGLLERFLDDDCGLLRASAAIALAQIDREHASPRVREILAHTIKATPRVTGPWPWPDGGVAAFARTVRLAILPLGELLDEADAAHAGGDWESAREYAMKAFNSAFHDGLHGPLHPWKPDELDPVRRRILRFLVALAPRRPDEPAWLPMEVRTAFATGIFYSADDVLRLIGDQTGPLDRRVSMEGREVPAWFALHAAISGAITHDTLASAFAAVPEVERVGICEEAIAGRFGLARDRRPFDFSDPAAYARENDYASAFILAIAAILAAAGPAAIALAERIAAAQLALDERARDAKSGLIAVVVVARRAADDGRAPPERLDALIRFDLPPATTYRLAIHEALTLLGSERAARLLGDVRLWGYAAYRDPRGEVRRWTRGRGWDVIGWLDPGRRADLVVEALCEWERHRAAGDDPRAEPVTSVTTHSQLAKPSPDEPFPRDRAIELLRTCGEVGRAAIETAILSGAVADAVWLRELRASRADDD